jgi:tagatose-1,6-bisphosphate aldolase non-catalytic subunit AgaZ/GatZ
MVTRSAEPNGKPVSQEVLDYRAAIRLASDAKEAAIEATADTAELAAYITGTEYPVWPSDSHAPVESVAIDELELAFDGGATGGSII